MLTSPMSSYQRELETSWPLGLTTALKQEGGMQLRRAIAEARLDGSRKVPLKPGALTLRSWSTTACALDNGKANSLVPQISSEKSVSFQVSSFPVSKEINGYELLQYDSE